MTYALVDNFDTYDDKCNRIFWTWIDQYGYSNPAECSMPGAAGNGTGSTVGNASAPYAEQTIVHGGSRSMPMSFVNTNSPYYSEAQREWPTPQAWTAGGANTLRLYVRGDAASFIESPSGVILMNGLGADIYLMTDEFHFAYKQLTGDGSITARVDSIKGALEWIKAGVMIRSSLSPGFQQVHMVATFGNRVEFMPRLTEGADAVGIDTGAGSITFPQWVRITRKGNTFTGEYSADGVIWKVVSGTTPATITMPSTVYIGLVVNSNSAGIPAAAQFSAVSITGSGTAGAWQLAEVGRTQVEGNKPETFYVAIQDSSGKLNVVNNPDPSVIATGGWEEWNVSLSQFTTAGVNLGSVKKLIIGVGNRNAPKAGGSGKVLIDDIQLMRIVP
jgi:regulation of enolase protein 1 (concanavalin A-like superfamily)